MIETIPHYLRKEVNSGLERYLESLNRAQPFTPRSWSWDGENGNPFLEPDIVLKKWTNTLTRKLRALKDENAEIILLFDTSAASKWGPQGGHEPYSQLAAEIVSPTFLMGESQTPPPGFFDPEWAEALEIVNRTFRDAGIGNLSPRAYESVTIDMATRGTLESNSGFPDFTRRSGSQVRAKAVADAYNGNWRTYPAILLFRRYRGKTRMVWMFPFSVNIVEGSYFQPLYAAISNSSLYSTFFCPWGGFEPVRLAVTNSYGGGDEVGASDFSSTDAHFQRFASMEVLKVLEPLFKPEHRLGLRESVLHMHSIPLLVGPNTMLVGEHGVASGSNWTNFIETVFDFIFANYVALKEKKAGYNVSGLYAIGDDMAWTSGSFAAGFQQRLESYGLRCGQVVKAEKTMVEKNKVKTLQRLFIRGYSRPDGQLRGVYPTIRALNSIIYPERFHFDWNSDYYCDRTFGILENCVDHPLFEDFVRFVCSGNRHLIPFAHKDDDELREIHGKAKLIPGLVPTYNREKRDEELSGYASIRIARGLI